MTTKEDYRDDWIIAGVILGGLFLVGVLAWALKKHGSPRREFKLRRVTEPHVILKNIERRKVIRDKEGNLKEIIITREVKSFE